MTIENETDKIEDIDCSEAIDKLYAYLDNEIHDTGAIRKLEHHLKHCHSCFTRSQLESELSSRMQQAAKKQTSAALQQRLRNIIKQL